MTWHLLLVRSRIGIRRAAGVVLHRTFPPSPCKSGQLLQARLFTPLRLGGFFEVKP